MKISTKKIAEYYGRLNEGFDVIERDDYLNEKGILKKAFTRSRKITFKLVMLYLFSMATNGQKKSATSTIAELWKNLGIPFLFPSRQAMIKALGFISVEKVKNIILNLALYNAIEYNVKLFHKMRVYLVDGSKAKLPRNKYTLEAYGTQSTNPCHYPQMHILTFCELGTNVIKNYVIGTRKACEKKLLLQGMCKLEKGSILVSDCGLHSAGLGYLISKKGYFYAIRVNEKNATQFIKGLTFKKNSVVTEMKITKDMRKNYEGLEHAPDTVRVRIVRIRGASANRRAVYIMTNLHKPEANELSELYLERQRVEDSFKFQKMYGGLEFIHPNTKKHMIELSIAGIIGYYNMVQLALSKVSKTPSPNAHRAKVLNRKVGWENVMMFFLMYVDKGIVDKNLALLLERTVNIIKVGRFYLRCSLQPLNPHQRSKVKKTARRNHHRRLEEKSALMLYCQDY